MTTKTQEKRKCFSGVTLWLCSIWNIQPEHTTERIWKWLLFSFDIFRRIWCLRDCGRGLIRISLWPIIIFQPYEGTSSQFTLLELKTEQPAKCFCDHCQWQYCVLGTFILLKEFWDGRVDQSDCWFDKNWTIKALESSASLLPSNF